jgi:hypothetical protein
MVMQDLKTVTVQTVKKPCKPLWKVKKYTFHSLFFKIRALTILKKQGSLEYSEINQIQNYIKNLSIIIIDFF